jgi:hypothetical protein
MLTAHPRNTMRLTRNPRRLTARANRSPARERLSVPMLAFFESFSSAAKDPRAPRMIAAGPTLSRNLMDPHRKPTRTCARLHAVFAQKMTGAL